MQDHSNLQPPVSMDPEQEAAPPPSWWGEAAELLKRVATMCVEHGVDVETFMRSAWATYVDARPGMREQLEEQQLVTQLAALRATGKLGQA